MNVWAINDTLFGPKFDPSVFEGFQLLTYFDNFYKFYFSFCIFFFFQRKNKSQLQQHYICARYVDEEKGHKGDYGMIKDVMCVT